MPKAPPKSKPSTVAARKRAPFHDGRRTTTQRGYGWDHQKARARLLAREPLCRACKGEGKTTAATIADHIVPLAEGGSRGEDNLQPLCTTHHAEKTASEAQRGRKRAMKGRGAV